MTSLYDAAAVAVAFEARILLADWAAEAPEAMVGWHLMPVTDLHTVCDPNVAFDDVASRFTGLPISRDGDDIQQWYDFLSAAMDAYNLMWLSDAGSTAH